MEKWKLKSRIGILVTVLVLDGALFGMSAGIMRGGERPGSRTVLGREAVPERETAPGRETVPGSGSVPGREARPAELRRENEDILGGAGQMKDGAGGSSQKLIALTFDDGPHREWTAKLLDGLAERDVKATFFLMGENIGGNEELVKRMYREGHLIGNHSYRHIQLTKEGETAVCEAVERTEQIISDITGFRPQYLRPPYGDWNEELECRLDLTSVFWTVDSLDWKLKNRDKIVRRVEKKVGNGDIILMHDIFPTSVDAALQLVDDLKDQGYSFVTVDELLID